MPYSAPRLRAGQMFRRNMQLWLCLLLLAGDVAALMVGVGLGMAAQRVAGLPFQTLPVLMMGIAVYVAVAFQNQAYHSRCLMRPSISCRKALLSLGATILIFLLVAFSLKVTNMLPRLALSVAGIGAAVAIVGHRVAQCLMVRRRFPDGLCAELLILDGGPVPSGYAGRDVIDAPALQLRSDLDDPYMLNRLGTLVQGYDRVIVSCATDRQVEWAEALKGANISGEIVMPDLGRLRPLAVQSAGGVSTVVVARGPLNLANRAKKRALDIAFTLPVLIAIAPLLLAVAVAIKLDSRGSVFFRQERMGRGNRIFRILKFRSMYEERADTAGVRSASRADDRITRVGRFIRRTSIDELPQLINVLLGEMSLVGPRPHALGSRAGDELFWRVDRQYWHRHALKPGITGLAQVRGFRGATESRQDILNRLEADLEYLHGWSLMRDIGILAVTARVMVHRNAY